MASSDSHHHHTPKVFYGPVINPDNLTFHFTLPHCLLSVDASGEIDWMMEDVDEDELEKTLESKKVHKDHLVRLNDGEFLMPGFIDTHTVKTFLITQRSSLPKLIFGGVTACSAVSDHGNVSWLAFNLYIYSFLTRNLLNVSRGNQYILLDWLEKLVFPMESEFNANNLQFVEKAYKSVVRRVLDFGVR